MAPGSILNPLPMPANPYSDDYRLNTRLWFCRNPELDELIKARFEGLTVRASQGLLDQWGPFAADATPSAKLARSSLVLVILLDQFPRNMYRGTPQAFAFDDQALRIAKRALELHLDQYLSPAECVFYYCSLEHSVSPADVEASLVGFRHLEQVAPAAQTRMIRNFARACVGHLAVLKQFGRYPHRNAALDRQSTEEELDFLKNHKQALWMISQAPKSLAASKNDAAAPKNDGAASSAMPRKRKEDGTEEKAVRFTPRARKLRILCLHGFRQNARVFKQRTKKLAHKLEQVAELHYVTSPINYQPQGDTLAATLAAFGKVPDYPMQQVWWLSSEGNESYEGLDVSMSFLEQVFQKDGPFDGVLGFAQGGTLAAILAAEQPVGSIKFDFFIPISSFVPRAQSLAHLRVPSAIKTPALHILGLSDILVIPDRSRALYTLSDPAFARLEEHPYGHFAPGYWPLLSILRFVSPFYAQLSPCTLEQPPLQVLLQLATDSLRDGTATRESVRAQLTELAAHHHWKDLIVIADTAFDVSQLVVSLNVAVDSVASNPTESLAEFIIEQVTEIFVTQLKKDISCARLVESFRHAHVSSTNSALSDFLKVIEGFDVGVEAAEKWPSACSKAAPRLRSRVDGKFRLGKRIAAGIFPMQQMQALLGAGGGLGPTASADLEKKSKLMGYRFYKRTLSTIQQFRKELEPNYASNLHRQLIEARADPARFTALEELPISEYITYPRPEPVVPCSLEDLQPLLDYLRQGGAVAEQTAFPKGTLTVDGRLDLCKQVVGPQGIEPLLMAMMSTSQVKRLLLGNNIVGDGGAEAIARFIEERKDSPLDCWYIAGNEIGPHGFERVCQALAHDTKVNSLWLKRNPLSPAGMIPLRTMLAINQTISVIDLVNCGLLDEGVANLLPALMGPGRNRSLRHLYLGTNGITEKSAPLIAEFVQDHCELESFYLSLNRLGDKGVAIIARALQRNRCLRRISFASNRIGPEGALALCESLRHHPTIELLDLGFTKATVAVSELGNLIGDRGACYVSELLKSNDKLVALDLLHNSISQVGVNHIIDGLRSNQSLVLLQLTQFGKVHNEPGKEEIKALLSRNFNALTEDQRKHAQLVEIPPHISEIYSVYRTHLG